MRDIGTFLLVDWELASKIGGLVFWRTPPDRLPPGVGAGHPWAPWMDLWQLGLLLHGQRHVETPASKAYVQDLMANRFATAQEALEGVWQ
jgi:hypothetical protein